MSRREELLEVINKAVVHSKPSRRDRIRSKIAERTVRGEWQENLGSFCRIWTGPNSGSNGRGKCYPRMWLDGQTVAVHKVNWTNEHGFIPGKMTLDHLCRNRLCVADDHLELVTNKENNIRRAKAHQKEQRNGNTKDDLQGVGLPVGPDRRTDV